MPVQEQPSMPVWFAQQQQQPAVQPQYYYAAVAAPVQWQPLVTQFAPRATPCVQPPVTWIGASPTVVSAASCAATSPFDVQQPAAPTAPVSAARVTSPFDAAPTAPVSAAPSAASPVDVQQPERARKWRRNDKDTRWEAYQ